LFRETWNKHEFDARFQVVEIFLCKGTSKVFEMQKFFDSYSVVSKQQRTKMKQYFIDAILILQEAGLIENCYSIFQDGS
jgi:hypothetical protein